MWNKQTLLAISLICLLISPLQSGVFTWTELQGGVNGNVKAVIEYNNRIVVAGGFNRAGNINVSNIALWDNETGWFSLGAGFNDTVYTLMVFNGELYAGGRFTQSGGSNVSYIARWTGTSWVNAGLGMNDVVRDMEIYNNQLVAGGHFTQAGGIACNRIATFNGFFWQPFGTGASNGVNNDVLAVAVHSGKIIAGGKFTYAGGDTANYIAGFSNGVWQTLGTGMNERVQTLKVYNGQLIAGGNFTSAGGNSCNHIAAWNGVSWSPIGSGMDKPVLSLEVYMGNIAAGGDFKFAGNTYCDRISIFKNGSWTRLLTGMNAKVNSMFVVGGILYAGGDFTTAGGKYAKHIAYWMDNAVIEIDGLVRYNDNNNPVLAGVVKALRIDVNTRELIYLDSAIITNGIYRLINVPKDTIYIISFPDDEIDGGFVPTYYPSTVDWTHATRVYGTQNISNINIGVFRVGEIPLDNLAGVSGHVYLNYNPPFTNGLPYKDGAIIYLKQNNSFKRFTVSNDYEEYSLPGVATGTYDVFVYRAGYTSGYRSIVLTEPGIDTLNFYLDTVGLIGIKKINDIIPNGYILSQNYPNPFNPVTIISFSLPVSGNALLSVYNSAGQLVKTLINEVLSSGKYEVTWNASGLPSGIYFCRLTAGDFSSTIKMVLVK